MIVFAFLLLWLMTAPALAQVTPTDPTAPALAENTAAAPLSIKTTVTTHAALQAALNAAVCGDLIPVAIAGWTATSGQQITLPVAAGSCLGVSGGSGQGAITGSTGRSAVAGASGVSAVSTRADNYITIASANYASLNPGVITDAQVGNMATITIPSDSNGYFVGQLGTHHIRFLGIKLLAPAGTGSTCTPMAACGAVQMQIAGTTGSDIHHIIFDRSIIDGDATNGMLRAVQFAGAHFSFIKSRIRNNFDPNHASEGQGILLEGTGPFLIDQSEVQANSEAVFIGDSSVDIWTGGSYGVGLPVIPADLTVTSSWIHQSGIPNTAMANAKNEFESKHAKRVKWSGNKIQYHPESAQYSCVNLVSYRGSQSAATDYELSNNWVIDCVQAMNITFRPTEAINITGAAGDGTTNCAGGACVKITLIGACDCTTGDGVQITGIVGTTEANVTVLPITRIDSTHVTIPIKFVNAYTSGGQAQFYFQGTPLRRVKITNNYFMNIASAAASSVTAANNAFLLLNPVANPTFTGGADGSLSTTGDWYPDDFNFSHNTLANPTAGDVLNQFIKINDDPTVSAVWQGRRWAIRDNAVKLSDGTASLQSTTASGGPGGFTVGTAALNRLSDPTTRDFSHNIGWNATSFGPTDQSTYTGSDTWITNSTSGCAAVITLSNCTGTAISDAALQAGSAGHNTASDGTDVGANMTTLAAALANVPN